MVNGNGRLAKQVLIVGFRRPTYSKNNNFEMPDGVKLMDVGEARKTTDEFRSSVKSVLVHKGVGSHDITNLQRLYGLRVLPVSDLTVFRGELFAACRWLSEKLVDDIADSLTPVIVSPIGNVIRESLTNPKAVRAGVNGLSVWNKSDW